MQMVNEYFQLKILYDSVGGVVHFMLLKFIIILKVNLFCLNDTAIFQSVQNKNVNANGYFKITKREIQCFRFNGRKLIQNFRMASVNTFL